MENREERIRGRYFRKTAAHPDGSVAHHGDCDFWNIALCTCGLLHDLRPADPSTVEDLYPSANEEIGQHDRAREALMHPRRAKH